MQSTASPTHVDTLVSIRSGALSPYVHAPERKARVRARLAARVLKSDVYLLMRYRPRKCDAKRRVLRKLNSLAARLALALTPPVAARPAATVRTAHGPITVVYETEEERACSSPHYTMD